MVWDRGLVVRIRLRMYQSGEREMGPVNLVLRLLGWQLDVALLDAFECFVPFVNRNNGVFASKFIPV